MFHTPPIKAAHTTTTTTEHPLSSETIQLLPSTASDKEVQHDDQAEEEVKHVLPDELSQLIKTFLKDLMIPKHSRPIDADQLSSIFQDFYSDFSNKAEVFVKGSVAYRASYVNKVELLTKEEQEQQNKTRLQLDRTVRRYTEMAEQQVTEEMSGKLFSKFHEDVAVNKYINAKIVALQKVKGIDYDKFIDVEGVDLNDSQFTALSHSLSELNNQNSPASKLTTILNIHSQINQLVKSQLQTKSVSGDYFLPLLIYIVLIHTDHTDLYLHFLFISRFRNATYLIEEPLYCLTNFEAALTYTRTLILTQDSLDFSKLSNDEYLLLSQPTDLPVRKSSIVQNDTTGSLMSPIPMTSDGIKSLGIALDTSFKTLVKFGTDSAETGYNPLKGLAAGVLRWRSSTPSNSVTPIAVPSVGQADGPAPEVLEKTIRTAQNDVREGLDRPLPNVDLTKFKGKDFKDLTIADLETVWKDYKSLISYAVDNTK